MTRAGGNGGDEHVRDPHGNTKGGPRNKKLFLKNVIKKFGGSALPAFPSGVRLATPAACHPRGPLGGGASPPPPPRVAGKGGRRVVVTRRKPEHQIHGVPGQEEAGGGGARRPEEHLRLLLARAGGGGRGGQGGDGGGGVGGIPLQHPLLDLNYFETAPPLPPPNLLLPLLLTPEWYLT